MSTKITTASVRIALSHQYSTFEITANIENEEGIKQIEVDQIRKQVQKLANDAVNEYKNLPNSSPKIELQRVEQKIKEIKKMVEGEKPEIIDPKAIEEIQKLPAYPSKKA